MNEKTSGETKIESLQRDMNEYVPTNFVESTLNKLAETPERLLGVLHANSFQMGSLVSFGYSRNNSYGNAIEKVFSSIIKDNGWNIEPTKYKLEDYDLHNLSISIPRNKKSIAVDQVFSNDSYYVFIEQKIRDDHDTSKAPGQWANYELKFRILNEIIKHKTVIGIMWMIDDNFDRNKSFYSNDEHMGKMQKEFPKQNFLLYGKQIDDKLNELSGNTKKDYFSVFDEFLKEWHSNAPKIPNLNFDQYSFKVSEAFDKMNKNKLESFFKNEQIIKEAFPILFPKLEAIRSYKKYLENKKDKSDDNNTIIKLIDDILKDE